MLGPQIGLTAHQIAVFAAGGAFHGPHYNRMQGAVLKTLQEVEAATLAAAHGQVRGSRVGGLRVLESEL